MNWKALLKNLGVAAGAGAAGYVSQHMPETLTVLHIPEPMHLMVGLGIGAAIGHWLPKPTQPATPPQ